MFCARVSAMSLLACTGCSVQGRLMVVHATDLEHSLHQLHDMLKEPVSSRADAHAANAFMCGTQDTANVHPSTIDAAIKLAQERVKLYDEDAQVAAKVCRKPSKDGKGNTFNTATGES